MPRRRRSKEVRNVVVISDTHFGCRLALLGPDGATLDDGGTYQPSRLQKKLWEIWSEFWGEWVPRVTHGEPFVVVHNGDVVDGVHHGSTHQWSHNLNDQALHGEEVLKPIVELCEGRYYHIRGTDAQLFDTDAEALTAVEISKKLGRSRVWVMRHLKIAAQKGRLTVTKKKIRTISDHVQTVAAYKIKPE